MRAALSDVTDFRDEMLGKLALNGQVPLMHRGILDVWIKRADGGSLEARLSYRGQRSGRRTRRSRHGDRKSRRDPDSRVGDKRRGHQAAIRHSCGPGCWDIYPTIEQEARYLARHRGDLESGQSVE